MLNKIQFNEKLFILALILFVAGSTEIHAQQQEISVEELLVETEVESSLSFQMMTPELIINEEMIEINELSRDYEFERDPKKNVRRRIFFLGVIIVIIVLLV